MDFAEAIKYVSTNKSFKTKEDMIAYARCMATHMRQEDYREMLELWEALCAGFSYNENIAEKRLGSLLQIHPTIQPLMVAYAISIRRSSGVFSRKEGREAEEAYLCAMQAADTILTNPYVVWNEEASFH